jgi:hypothetical protein
MLFHTIDFARFLKMPRSTTLCFSGKTAVMHGQSTFWSSLLRVALAALFGCGALVACRKPSGDSALDSTPRPGTPSAGLVSEKSPGDLVNEAGALVAEFDRADSDDARRTELIGELAVNGTPAARAALARIYRATADIEVKKQVLESLPLIESPELEPSLSLLREALASDRDPDLRATAAETLREFDSPQTIRIWRSLLDDRDEEIRETAKNMIEFLGGDGSPK